MTLRLWRWPIKFPANAQNKRLNSCRKFAQAKAKQLNNEKWTVKRLGCQTEQV